MERNAEPDESPALRMNLLLLYNRIFLRSAVFVTTPSMVRSPSDLVHLGVVTAIAYAVLSYIYDTYMLYPFRALSFPH